ncbi:transposase-like protein [Bradyrhizobium sp. USDA 4486]
MDTHKNAPLTPKGREAMVRSVIEGGLTKAAAALQFNVTAKTVAKWVQRFREQPYPAAARIEPIARPGTGRAGATL